MRLMTWKWNWNVTRATGQGFTTLSSVFKWKMMRKNDIKLKATGMRIEIVGKTNSGSTPFNKRDLVCHARHTRGK
jgi:hypothetical protein